MVKVQIGCGARIFKGWHNIDCTYSPPERSPESFYPESIRGTQDDLLLLDVTKSPLPFEDNSVDIIFHEDFIEHLAQRDQIVFLAETLRVLKPGGCHRVNTPNLLQMQRRSNFGKGFSGVAINEWDRWHHLNVLTPPMLAELATMVGYSKVYFNSRNHSIVAEHIPLEYRPGSDRQEDENIFADLVK